MKHLVVKVKGEDLYYNADEGMGEYVGNTPMLLDQEQADSIMKYCPDEIGHIDMFHLRYKKQDLEICEVELNLKTTSDLQTTTSVSVDDALISGEGKLLYSIIIVDDDDTEDTSMQIWRANNEDHLYEQVLENLELEDFMEQEFENDWGFSWIPKLIGEVK